MQHQFIWRGIQHLKKRPGHFCATEPWSADEAVPAVVRRRQELCLEKTGTRHYFVNRCSLKLLEHWVTHIWIGLYIYFLQYCIKKFFDRAPLVSFARQGQGCRATSQESRCSSHFHKHCAFPTSLLRKLWADSWLLSLIARQPPLEIEKAFSSYHQDHGICVLYNWFVCHL